MQNPLSAVYMSWQDEALLTLYPTSTVLYPQQLSLSSQQHKVEVPGVSWWGRLHTHPIPLTLILHLPLSSTDKV